MPSRSFDSLPASDREERPEGLRGEVPRETGDPVVHGEYVRTRMACVPEAVIAGDARVSSVVEPETHRAPVEFLGLHPVNPRVDDFDDDERVLGAIDYVGKAARCPIAREHGPWPRDRDEIGHG